MKYLYLPTLLVIAILYTNYFEENNHNHNVASAPVEKVRAPASVEIKKETWNQKIKNFFIRKN